MSDDVMGGMDREETDDRLPQSQSCACGCRTGDRPVVLLPLATPTGEKSDHHCSCDDNLDHECCCRSEGVCCRSKTARVA